MTLRSVPIHAMAILMSLLMEMARGAEPLETVLLVVERSDCVYCEKFNEEIATAYPLTEEGKIASLRRVDADNWPENLHYIEQEDLTPTFILIQGENEIGRLRGYPGDEYFWFLIGELFAKLEPVVTPVSSGSDK